MPLSWKGYRAFFFFDEMLKGKHHGWPQASNQKSSPPNSAKDKQNYFAGEALKNYFAAKKQKLEPPKKELNAQPVHAHPEDPGQAVVQKPNSQFTGKKG